MQSIALTIKGFRKARKLTQDQFGALVGVTGRTISTWETRRGGPNRDQIRELIRVLKLPPDEAARLFYGPSPDARLETIARDMDPTERDQFFDELRAEADRDATLFAHLRDLLVGRKVRRNGDR